MIIYDDFIQDQNLLDQIKNDKTFFSTNGKYYWYDGWWMQKADTLKKQLIEKLWGNESPYRGIKIAGFEYWTGQFGDGCPEQNLIQHFDKDEEHWEKTGEVIAPVIGSVSYLVPMDIEGGNLEIFSQGEDKEPEVVQAKFNRLVIFNAGQHIHKVNLVNKGVRSAIAINLWQHKPSGCESGSLLHEAP